ncbi:MAG: UPF0280 family protein [Deltaproteobacteria bacterium]|nr:UPF0280 family protein [Deltaproteobacteria bacterium]
MGGKKQRRYRNLVKSHGLATFQVSVGETDLFVTADRDFTREVRDAVVRYRRPIEAYIAINPVFRDSLIPLEEDPLAPRIVRQMLWAGQRCGVGPMASVAGAISEFVGQDLLARSREVIVENGGDVYMRSTRELRVAVYAGSSPLSLEIGISIGPHRMPLGVCTSSGTVGHSRSLGRADAVCVLSKSATLADAAATAVGNRVRCKGDIEEGLGRAREIEGVEGVLIVVGDAVGVWGDVELVRIQPVR